jgi:hypothetical protein
VLTVAIVCGVMVALAAAAGQVGESLPGIVALTVPLLVAGVSFDVLVHSGRLRLGWGPGIVFWAFAFTLSRFLQEAVLHPWAEGPGLREGVVPFLAYQTIVGAGFGLGFLLLYQYMAAWLYEKERGEGPPPGGVPAPETKPRG